MSDFDIVAKIAEPWDTVHGGGHDTVPGGHDTVPGGPGDTLPGGGDDPSDTPAVIEDVRLSPGSDTGISNSDNITSETRPVITYTVEQGATVQIDWGDGNFVPAPVATGLPQTATSPGYYSYDTHVITVMAWNANGLPNSQSIEVTVDDRPPDLFGPGYTDSSTGEYFSEEEDVVTSDTTPQIDYSAEKGSTVEIDWGDGRGYVAAGLGTGTSQTVTLETGYTTDGEKLILVRATDAAGNSHVNSRTITIVSDVNAPSVSGISDDTGTPGDGITNDQTIEINGTADPNVTVDVFVSEVLVGSTKADGQGNWTYDLTGKELVEGEYSINAIARNEAGGTSDPSDTFNLTVDTSIDAPVITSISNDTGASAEDGITNDNTVTVNGTAGKGETVNVYVDGKLYATVKADGEGDWTATLGEQLKLVQPNGVVAAFQQKGQIIKQAPLADGTYSITATATDIAGNTSDPSKAFELTVDTVAPGEGEGSSYTFVGEDSEDQSGYSVSSAGDVDGDGKADLLIAAPGAEGGPNEAGDQGHTYLVASADLAAADAADGETDGIIDLGNVAAQSGSYVLVGEDTDDLSGNSVSSAGDVDNDGKADLLIGAYNAEGGPNEAAGQGQTYLVSSAILAAADAADGETDGIIDLGHTAAQTGSYVFFGEDAGDQSGLTVSSAGDVDGDGRDDLLIGANDAEGGPNEASNQGHAYLVTAADLVLADSIGGGSGNIDLGLVAGLPNSYVFVGEDSIDGAGWSVSSAGDVDGDGKADLLIGSFFARGGPNDAFAQGHTYLVTAADLAAADSVDGADGIIDLGNIAVQSGSYVFAGADAGDTSGFSVSSAGDVDGDGKDDLLIGAYGAEGGPNEAENQGLTYLVTAADLAAADEADADGADGFIDLGNIAAQNGSYVFVGEDADDRASVSVSSAGDVDGDGKADLLIGAKDAEGGPNEAAGQGLSYLIAAADLAVADAADGNSDGIIDLGNIAAQTNSYVFVGEDADDEAGLSVSSAGDVDGDGKADLLIGTEGAEGGPNAEENQGQAYLVAAADLAEIDAQDGSADGVIDLGNIFLKPVPVSVDSVSDDSGIVGDGVTNDNTVTVNGTAEAGATVEVFVNKKLFAVVKADETGAWSADLSKPQKIVQAKDSGPDAPQGSDDLKEFILKDGTYSITAVATDLAGNTSKPSAAYELTVDTVAPEVSGSSYVFIGEDGEDASGTSVSSAGDVDGDGKDDLLIGAYKAEGGPNEASDQGHTYLVAAADLAAADAADGKTDGVIDLGNIAAQSGSYVLVGEDAEDWSGGSVSSAGDVDNDGRDDLLIGAVSAEGGPNEESGQGQTYLVAAANLATADAADGKADGIVDLGNIAAQTGSYVFFGEDGFDLSGVSVSSAGDVDGDNKDDFLIGAHNAAGGLNEAIAQGQTYLVTAADLELADTLSGGNGGIDLGLVASLPNSYVFVGEDAVDWAGISVSSAGDVDGDNKDDLLIGAYGAKGGPNEANAQGHTYLVTAADLAAADSVDGADGIIDLGNIAAQSGSYLFAGANGYDGSGYSVSSAGDVDGDGKDDLLIGAFGAEKASNSQFGKGHTYLVTAADLAAADAADADGADGIIDLGNVAAQNGSYVFVGEDAEDQSGRSVSSAGDVDGDGKADLLIGAHTAEGGSNEAAGQGLSYLVAAADLAAADAADGKSDGIIELSNVAAQTNSYVFVGEDADDGAGWSVSSAGDVDGDGKADVLISSIDAEGGPNAVDGQGQTYLVASADLAAIDEQDGKADGVIGLGNTFLEPAGAVVNKVTDDNGPVNGSTKDTTIEISGRAEENTTIEIFLNGNSIGTTKTDAKGNWTYDHTHKPLASGSYAITAVATDLAGNSSEPSDVFDLQITNQSGGSSSSQDDAVSNTGGSSFHTTFDVGSVLDDLLSYINETLIKLQSEFVMYLGKEGNDTIEGGDNAEIIWAGADSDSVSGGLGDDTIGGGTGSDTLHGGDGNDILYGNTGEDFVFGNLGIDNIWAGSGNDITGGGDGNDQVGAGDGDDAIFGGAGNDIAYGGEGKDTLYGGADNDTLYGGAGNDTLYGGAGDDTLFGGEGDDTYAFEKDFGNDGIYGFVTNGENKLDLTDLGLSGKGDLVFTQDGDNLVIDTGSGKITLYDTKEDDLDPANDILF